MTELKALGGRWARGEVLPPVLAGVALGMAAFAVDLVPEAVGRFLVPAFSSGFAWGVVALAVSCYAPTLRSALVAGVGTLALATLTYYGLVASLSRQWLSGSGPTPSPDGLSSVTRASAFWLAGALSGGLVLGCLAHVVRVGTARNASIALGVAFGLLTSEAAYAIFHVIFIWVGPVDSFVWARLGAAAVQLLLAAAVAFFALRLRRPPVSLWVFLVTATVSTAVSAASWHLIESVRMTL
ncbi:hypothetical protein OOK41_06345 [Micromonospora sp. NBC_01655]|uniref:hypothetical protein n=1 Tax=Micromonospora sp. NBC_01655 TaxID=2975983 RepID=UPI00225BDAE8|nr:hypothetical protein [Micromonospora sp. NBC_01655]MCX4469926.1 hypothetical protein [Micromonospora sp. NBC_01655]